MGTLGRGSRGGGGHFCPVGDCVCGLGVCECVRMQSLLVKIAPDMEPSGRDGRAVVRWLAAAAAVRVKLHSGVSDLTGEKHRVHTRKLHRSSSSRISAAQMARIGSRRLGTPTWLLS